MWSQIWQHLFIRPFSINSQANSKKNVEKEFFLSVYLLFDNVMWINDSCGSICFRSFNYPGTLKNICITVSLTASDKFCLHLRKWPLSGVCPSLCGPISVLASCPGIRYGYKCTGPQLKCLVTNFRGSHFVGATKVNVDFLNHHFCSSVIYVFLLHLLW